jgi:hypothetical protein
VHAREKSQTDLLLTVTSTMLGLLFELTLPSVPRFEPGRSSSCCFCTELKSPRHSGPLLRRVAAGKSLFVIDSPRN